MGMYNKNKPQETTIELNEAVIGESLETKIERILENGEGVTEAVPIIHTPRAEGVLPEYNVRTDRFDVALEGTDYIQKSNTAKAEEKAEAQRKAREEALNPDKKGDNNGKPESTQGQDTK